MLYYNSNKVHIFFKSTIVVYRHTIVVYYEVYFIDKYFLTHSYNYN